MFQQLFQSILGKKPQPRLSETELMVKKIETKDTPEGKKVFVLLDHRIQLYVGTIPEGKDKNTIVFEGNKQNTLNEFFTLYTSDLQAINSYLSPLSAEEVDLLTAIYQDTPLNHASINKKMELCFGLGPFCRANHTLTNFLKELSEHETELFEKFFGHYGLFIENGHIQLTHEASLQDVDWLLRFIVASENIEVQALQIHMLAEELRLMIRQIRKKSEPTKQQVIDWFPKFHKDPMGFLEQLK